MENFNLNDAYQLISSKLLTWVESAIAMLPNMVISILILLFFVFIGSLIKKLVFNILGRFTHNDSLQNLISSITYIVIIAIGAFIGLSILNLDGVVTSLLAGAGIIGLALGFAFQEIASNYIAGTVMSINRPFELGDLIETNDFFGNVLTIHLRTTKVQTVEGQLISIPNAMVFKNPITNYSRLQKRRVDITVGVSYDEDLEKAKEVTLEAIRSIKGIKKEDVSLYYSQFNDSSIDFNVRYWIPFTNKQVEYVAKVDEGVIAIKKAFDAADITIPFPIRTLDFGSGTPQISLNTSNTKTIGK